MKYSLFTQFVVVFFACLAVLGLGAFVVKRVWRFVKPAVAVPTVSHVRDVFWGRMAEANAEACAREGINSPIVQAYLKQIG